MPALRDITGQRFGRLTALEYIGDKNWKFICDCGIEKIIIGNSVRRGLTTSCGCYGRRMLEENRPSKIKHGHAFRGKKTSIYQRWRSMIQRCVNPKNRYFSHYGGRGIKVCDRWRNSFEAFYVDVGEPPPGKSLDRKNNDGDYEPLNVRWATPAEQSRNRKRS